MPTACPGTIRWSVDRSGRQRNSRALPASVEPSSSGSGAGGAGHSAAHRLATLRGLYVAQRAQSLRYATKACATCRTLQPLLSSETNEILKLCAEKEIAMDAAIGWQVAARATLAKIRALEAKAWGSFVLNDHAERVVK
jgi:hypothetical protein